VGIRLDRINKIYRINKMIRINDFTEKTPIQPQRHQDTKFIKDEVQVLQSQYAKYLIST